MLISTNFKVYSSEVSPILFSPHISQNVTPAEPRHLSFEPTVGQTKITATKESESIIANNCDLRLGLELGGNYEVSLY